MKSWAKAFVSDKKDDILEITFENDTGRTQRLMFWYSPDIERYNTHSQGDEWRSQLKIGDLIDAIDSTKQWFTSTVLDKCMRLEDNKEYPSYHIGFRTYHAEGNKEDNHKRKYFGWSETFDTWISAYSPRIQKMGTFAKHTEDPLAGTKVEESLDD